METVTNLEKRQYGASTFLRQLILFAAVLLATCISSIGLTWNGAGAGVGAVGASGVQLLVLVSFIFSLKEIYQRKRSYFL